MKTSTLIHIFAALAAGIGAGLAQLPGSDAPILVALQTAMILAIADRQQASMHATGAAELALTMAATMIGRALCQIVLGWLPGLGNLVNALTAAAVTELVGWCAVRWLRRV